MDMREAEALVARHAQAVYRLAYARTGSREDAEDVTQETFLRLVRTAPEFADEDHCRAWLLRVAMNCAGDLFRSAWRRHTRPLEEAEQVPAPEEGGVLEAVLALPERYRAPIHLFYYEGLSTAEIAAVLGKSEGAVRTRLSRARTMLRGVLEECESHD
ncbi:DNA-directed RNA polymerase sigma-70 factor [Oscillospiraceae bacterium]|nr:DNA-directed RNA polymerase sigma-70 factor [Oscillospiraceae bacterium]BDF74423.1 DNA-directed RNA polymerase sigma-70 factor [Oscillospiraceae bacterium]